MTWTNAVAVLFLLVFLNKVWFYQHRGRPYSRGRHADGLALGLFRWVDVYLRLSTLVICLASLYSDSPWLAKMPLGPACGFIGVALVLVAEVLFVWAMIALGSQYSPCFDSHLPTNLVDSGPYARIRHPIYLANTILFCGAVLITSSAWMFGNLGILAVFYTTAARREENGLAEKLHGFKEYQAVTGRILPKLRRSRA